MARLSLSERPAKSKTIQRSSRHTLAEPSARASSQSASSRSSVNQSTSPDAPVKPMLELKNVSSGYGAIEALKAINISIRQGEIVTLIGANGAGKSTTLRNITGLVPAKSGEIIFEGQRLNGMPTHRIAALGVSLVPEGRAIFANLSVSENLEMGAY